MTKNSKNSINTSRRRFIVDSSLLGGGLAIGLTTPWAIAQGTQINNDIPEVNAWVVIKPDDTFS